MNPDIEMWLGSGFVGAGVAVLSYSCRDYFALAFRAIERDFADKLRRLRASTTSLRQYLIAWLVIMGLAFCVLGVALGNLVFAVLVTALLACAPWYLLRRMAERHRQKIEDQLADSMVMLSNAVKAGLSLAQALELLAAQCPNPISAEFRQIVGEYKMGKPLEQTVTEAKARLRSENFALFAAAMLASHESGGRLNETVERIAQSVMELQRLDRKIHSETTQARKSAVYMALAPAFILLVYWFVDPVNTQLLFTEVFGQVLLGIAVVLNVIAYLWARVILNPDI